MTERPLSHRAFRTHKLQFGERIERTWVAGVPWSQEDTFRGRLSKFGGNLVLTNQRLLFEPLGAPKLGGGLKGLELSFLKGMRAIELEKIEAVEPYSRKGPPRLRLRLRTGERIVLAVMRKRLATIWSKDASARDDAIATIMDAVERVSAPTAAGD